VALVAVFSLIPAPPAFSLVRTKSLCIANRKTSRQHCALNNFASDKYVRLFDWAAEKGAHISPKIGPEVRPTTDGGAGIFANEFIGSNEKLLYFPVHIDTLAILQTMPDSDPIKNNLLDLADGSKGNRVVALTGALAHLHLLRQTRGVESKFGPYFDVLPLLPCLSQLSEDNWKTNVLSWSEEEISEFLAGTMAHSKAVEIRVAAVRIVRYLRDTLFNQHFDEGRGRWSKVDVENAIVSSFACVLSRGFCDDGGGKWFFPVLDLLNHSSEKSNVQWTITAEGAASLVSTRDIEKGSELLANYGQKPAWDFGMEYSFIPDYVPNDSTGVPLFPQSVLKPGDTNIDQNVLGSIVKKIVLVVTDATGVEPTIRTQFCSAEMRLMMPCIVVQSNSSISEVLPSFQAAFYMLSASLKNTQVSMCELKAEIGCNHVPDALKLLRGNIQGRTEMLARSGALAQEWATRYPENKHIKERLDLANTMRELEIDVLHVLRQKAEEFENEYHDSML